VLETSISNTGIKCKDCCLFLLKTHHRRDSRFKAENANDLLSKELKKLVPKMRMIEVYKVIMQQE
jgi:hypothetical protein